MKNRTGNCILCWLLGLALAVSSCTDNEPALTRDDDCLITEARDFFENEFDPQLEEAPNARQGNNKRWTINRTLLWDNAYIRQLEDSTQAIIIPVHFGEQLSMQATGNRYSLGRLSYIMIYTDAYGKISLEVVTTLPDSAYLATATPYTRFSGVVYVENWRGKLLRSIRHINGGMALYEPEPEAAGNNGRILTEAYCEILVDWYSCGSIDGGETWECHYDYTEVVFGLCDNGGGSSTPCTTCFNYTPATGSGGGGTGPGDDEELPEVCPDGYMRDNKGKCIKIIDPCNTDDNVLNSTSMQTSFKNIWAASNALDTNVPMADRLEQGGWIVLNNGAYSFIPFPATWIREPCGITPPVNWTNDIPPNLVGVVHSHPFYLGEDRRSVCGNKVEASYIASPSDDDVGFLRALNETTNNFSLKSYIIDGSKISKFGWTGYPSLKKYDRCGY